MTRTRIAPTLAERVRDPEFKRGVAIYRAILDAETAVYDAGQALTRLRVALRRMRPARKERTR